jgi:cytochrome c-type biogenesis protein CcmH
VTTFVIIAAVMVALALVWVLVPLLRPRAATPIAPEASNLAILRDQRAELDADLANGVLAPQMHEEAVAELTRRAADDTRASAAAVGPAPLAGAWTAAIVAGTMPLAAVILYVIIGGHGAFAPSSAVATEPGQHDVSPQKVAEMAGNLAARLEKDPGNAQGWIVLAHTYYAMKRFPDAVKAYERATALVPDNADLLADYADALGATQQGLQGKPLELIERALKIDPVQWKALALAGTAAFDRQDFKQAVAYWERLQATVPPDSEMGRSIEASIAEARTLGKMPAASPSASSAPAAPAKVAAAAAPAATATGLGVAGTISLSPALAASASPDDPVFIFARAVQGPKMPLAVMRKRVRDLPATFALDDSMAMAPEMKLSNFAEVVIGARVAKSGNAAPSSGDLEGFSKPVKLGAAGVTVVIDTPRP